MGTSNRREFLQTAAAATAFTIVSAKSVAGTEANSKIEIGLIGSGNRGVWLGDLAHRNTGIKVTAIADAFEDRLAVGREKLGVDPKRCFKGLDAYLEVIHSKVDAIAVESPAYFHVQQAKAGVDAGIHVYLAKPVAIDVPGCKDIIAMGKKAAGNKKSFLVDFQTRVTPEFMEAGRRVHAGDLGKIVCGQVYYHAGRLGKGVNSDDGSGATRLRNWFFDKRLSGDILVEQAVHMVDVANWYLKAHPEKAFGAGGRKGRVDVGDCWDHYAVTYWYPEVLVDFSCSQFCEGYADLVTRLYGTEGTVDAHYNTDVIVGGRKPYKGGPTKGMYTEGAITNLKTFEKAIRDDKPVNNSEESATSSLSTILGRMAAEKNAIITWEEMLKDDTRIDADIRL